MIKFFRNIRHRRLQENRFSKYLLYAIGEIILVVIGILIALQINNWNEERKLQSEIDKLLIDIENDLITNYELAETPLNFFKQQDSLARLILYNKLTVTDYLENHSLSFFTLNWDNYRPITKNINSLIEGEKLASSDYKPIIQSLKKLQSRKISLEETWTNLEDYINQTTYYFEDYPWLVKYDSLSNSQRAEFMLNNQGYKNKVMLYWAISQNFVDKITRFRLENMAALATLKRIKYNFSVENIEQLFNELQLTPYTKYNCNVAQEALQSLKSTRSSMLIGNFTDKDIKLKITNNQGQPIGVFQLTPNEIGTAGSEYFGIDGDNNQLIELKDNDGNCLQKYGATPNGYLIIHKSVTDD